MSKYVIAGGLDGRPSTWETSEEAWDDANELWNFVKQESLSQQESGDILITEINDDEKKLWYRLENDTFEGEDYSKEEYVTTIIEAEEV